MSTVTTPTPTQAEANVQAIRHNMQRQDWFPRYERDRNGGLTRIANVVYPDGSHGFIERVSPSRLIAKGAPELGRFPNNDTAARIIRADALRAWDEHDKENAR